MDYDLSRVDAVLDALDPERRRMIDLRFGLTSGTPMTLAEVADAVGSTPDEIRAVEQRVMAQLRE